MENILFQIPASVPADDDTITNIVLVYITSVNKKATRKDSFVFCK